MEEIVTQGKNQLKITMKQVYFTSSIVSLLISLYKPSPPDSPILQHQYFSACVITSFLLPLTPSHKHRVTL